MYEAGASEAQGLSAIHGGFDESAGIRLRSLVVSRTETARRARDNRRLVMAKGQMRSNKEKKKPKQDKAKKAASGPSPVFPANDKNRQAPPKGKK
jgi:hypothetical protein